MLPAGAISILPTAIFIGDNAVIAGEGIRDFLKKIQPVEKMTHDN
jgi:hypothetical protein